MLYSLFATVLILIMTVSVVGSPEKDKFEFETIANTMEHKTLSGADYVLVVKSEENQPTKLTPEVYNEKKNGKSLKYKPKPTPKPKTKPSPIPSVQPVHAPFSKSPTMNLPGSEPTLFPIAPTMSVPAPEPTEAPLTELGRKLNLGCSKFTAVSRGATVINGKEPRDFEEVYHLEDGENIDEPPKPGKRETVDHHLRRVHHNKKQRRCFQDGYPVACK